MSDRDAPTLPPPPEPFREPAMVHDTEPPISPAIVEAIRLVVREEVDRAVGALATRWGESHVALASKLDETKRIAENAITNGVDRERAAQNTALALNENLRAVRRLLDLPEHGTVAELAALAARGG